MAVNPGFAVEDTMNRRTLLRRIGATGIAATSVAGTATAETDGPDYGIDFGIDVSGVSGRVSLAELLSEDELERLNDDVNPARAIFVVDADMDTMYVNDCCRICCRYVDCSACEDCCACDISPGCIPYQ